MLRKAVLRAVVALERIEHAGVWIDSTEPRGKSGMQQACELRLRVIDAPAIRPQRNGQVYARQQALDHHGQIALPVRVPDQMRQAFDAALERFRHGHVIVEIHELLRGVDRVTRPQLIATVAREQVVDVSARRSCQKPRAHFDADVAEGHFHGAHRFQHIERLRFAKLDLAVSRAELGGESPRIVRLVE